MRLPHRAAVPRICRDRLAGTTDSATAAAMAYRATRATIRRLRPGARLPTKCVDASLIGLPIQPRPPQPRNRAAWAGAARVATSMHAKQPYERSANPLFPQILKQMAAAPAQRPSCIAVKGMHAMPCEGAAQVPPGDANPPQRPRSELHFAPEVIQPCAKARSTFKRPLQSEQAVRRQKIGFQRRRQTVSVHSLLHKRPIDGRTEVPCKSDEFIDLLYLQIAAIKVPQIVDLRVQQIVHDPV